MRRLLSLVAVVLLYLSTDSARAVAQDEGESQLPEGASFELVKGAVADEVPQAPVDSPAAL